MTGKNLYYRETGKPIKVFFEDEETENDENHVEGELIFLGEISNLLYKGKERASFTQASVGYFAEDLVEMGEWLKGFENMWEYERDLTR